MLKCCACAAFGALRTGLQNASGSATCGSFRALSALPDLADYSAADASGLDVLEAVANESSVASLLRGSDETSLTLAAEKAHAMSNHKVAFIREDGSVSVGHRTAKDMGLAVRDLPLIGPFHSKGRSGLGASISVREGKIIVRTELARAILRPATVILFECRRPAQTEKLGVAILRSIHSARRHPNRLPLELRVLEVLLDETCQYLEDKAGQIRLLSSVVQEDIRARVNTADIRRLLPLQKAVTALEYDIREMAEAVQEVANNEQLLSMLCLSEGAPAPRPAGWSPHMQLAHRLLTTYERRVRSLDSELRELTEHLDSTREVWHMQLDAMRNRIIRLNLHLGFGSLAAMLSVAPAALFGMNLVSGLETDPTMFWRVAYGSVAAGASVYAALYWYYQFWPMRNARRRVADMGALQDLLMYHVDEVGDVVKAVKRVYNRKKRISKADFKVIVNGVLGAASRRSMSQDEIDLLYRVLDTNRDGWIDVGQLAEAHNVVVMASQDSEGMMEAKMSDQAGRPLLVRE